MHMQNKFSAIIMATAAIATATIMLAGTPSSVFATLWTMPHPPPMQTGTTATGGAGGAGGAGGTGGSAANAGNSGNSVGSLGSSNIFVSGGGGNGGKGGSGGDASIGVQQHHPW